MGDKYTPSEQYYDVIKLQQEFFDLYGHQTFIIYDAYPTMDILKHRIELLMPGLKTEDISHLTSIIWDQRKFTGKKCLFMSPIFILCVHHVKLKVLKYPLDIKSKNISIHPVFRIQKCIAKSEDTSCTELCASFVDENARVYANWADYRKRNKLEDSLVVAPLNGIYNGFAYNKVILDIFMRESGITQTLDTGTTVVGLASAGVAAAALIPSVTVAPVVLAGAAVAGISCAVYSGIRSVYDLYDRSRHKQSINIKNRDARASWINIAAGTFTVSAAGATKTLSKAIANGSTVSKTAQRTLRFINIGAIGVNTTGLLDGIHSICDRVHNGEEISRLQLAQLSCALFMLTHSISNYTLAQKLIQAGENLESMSLVLRQEQKTNINRLVNHSIALRSVQNVAEKTCCRAYIKSFDNPEALLKLIGKISENRQGVFSFKFPLLSQEKKINIEKELIDSLPGPVKIYYSRVFDDRLNAIIGILRQQKDIKYRNESSLRLTIKLILRYFSLSAFEEFMSYIQRLLIDFRRTIKANFGNNALIEPIMKIVFEIINAYVSEIETDVETFLKTKLQINNDENNLDKMIKKNLSYMDKGMSSDYEKFFDEEHHLSSDSLSTDRQICISFDENVEVNVIRFRKFCKEYNIERLRETIVNILRYIHPVAVKTFFNLCFQLTTDYLNNIQLKLNIVIPIDAFLIEIFSLLKRLNEKVDNKCDRFPFICNDEMCKEIKFELLKMYDDDEPVDVNAKKINCESCSGNNYA